MNGLLTVGADFIGAYLVLDWLAQHDEPVINLDKLTYTGNLETLASLQGDARHVFVRCDIGGAALVARLLADHRPRAVINFAAESHVDRSIHGPEDFIQTEIVGTFHLLEAVRAFSSGCSPGADGTGPHTVLVPGVWPPGRAEGGCVDRLSSARAAAGHFRAGPPAGGAVVSDMPGLRLQDAWQQCVRHLHHLKHALETVRRSLPMLD